MSENSKNDEFLTKFSKNQITNTDVFVIFIIYKKIQKEKEDEAFKKRYLMETQRIVPNTETDVITIK